MTAVPKWNRGQKVSAGHIDSAQQDQHVELVATDACSQGVVVDPAVSARTLKGKGIHARPDTVRAAREWSEFRQANKRRDGITASIVRLVMAPSASLARQVPR